jgi:hypothetical protein
MNIYQVLNEDNQLYCEFAEIEQAMRAAHDLSALDNKHFYHVEEVELKASN